MKNTLNIFLWSLLIINIVIAIFFVNSWLFLHRGAPAIPDNLLVDNSLVKSTILELGKSSPKKTIAVAFVSSNASICVENKVAEIFKETRLKNPEIKLVMLLPENMSDQDISVFKANFRPNFEVIKMKPELSSFWEQISQKYQTPGIVILSNQNKLFASQDLSEIRKKIDTF